MVAASLTFFIGEADATTFLPRDDNAVAALDARTGERRWAYFPERLSDGSVELYPDRVFVHGYIDTQPRGNFEIGLDPASGKLLDSSTPGSPPLSGSLPPGEVRLENGWHLVDFDPGNDQDLVFADDKGNVTWTLATGQYPGAVRAWKNIALFKSSYLDEDMLYAYEAGSSAPLWTFRPDSVVSVPASVAGYFRVIGDDIYYSANEYVLELDPASGAVKRHWDLAALTGVPFEADSFDAPQFYSGGYRRATFSADNDTLAVGYERRLLALDRPSGDLLWHTDPGAFPHDPYPAVHGDLLVTIAGEQLAGPRPPETVQVTALDPGGCSISAGSAGSARGWGFAALFGAVFAVARRLRRQPTSPRRAQLAWSPGR
jgi:MYXO-CTERM domain-containing protein